MAVAPELSQRCAHAAATQVATYTVGSRWVHDRCRRIATNQRRQLALNHRMYWTVYDVDAIIRNSTVGNAPMKFVAIILFSSLISLSAFGGECDFEEAKDCRTAAKLRKAATQGDIEAQYELGFIYYSEATSAITMANLSTNVLRNYTQAAAFRRKATNWFRKAPVWFRKAATKGHASAQYLLGLMYAKGQGVPEDSTQAVHWYQKAAEQGEELAQVHLAFMYLTGRGVSRNHAEATFWYRKAAEQGDLTGQRFLRATEQNDTQAQYELGFSFRKGLSTPVIDSSLAAAWFRLAAEKGHAEAANSLGNMYFIGDELPENFVRAYAWYSIAAARGYKVSNEMLAHFQKSDWPEISSILMQEMRDGLALTLHTLRSIMSPFQLEQAQEFSALVWRRITQKDEPTSRYPDKQGPRKRASNSVASGSGFLVDGRGHVLTSHHVIEQCKRLTVAFGGQTRNATIKASNITNDLALLATDIKELGAFFRSTRAKLGEVVTAAGFPLGGLLSGELNVTSGEVSALAGVANDRSVLQITAPVQPGSSGGPLLDASGAVIGIVIAKLNVLKVAKLTGDIPQNVNFAVKGIVVRSFLEVHGIDYKTISQQVALGGAGVAELATKFTIPVFCHK